MRLHLLVLETREGAGDILRRMLAGASNRVNEASPEVYQMWKYVELGARIDFHSLFLEAHQRIVRELGDHTRNIGSDLLVVVVDDAKYARFLNPLRLNRSCAAHFLGQQEDLGCVISKLILALPEVAFVFAPLVEKGDKRCDHVVYDMLMTDLGKWTCPVVFDPFGVRSGILKQLQGDPLSHDRRHFRVRRDVAISLDDEQDYALFTAYCAYRQGARSLPLCRESAALYHLREGSWVAPVLTFEDVYLSFPDRRDDPEVKSLRYSSLHSDRCKAFPLLNTALVRVFCSTFHGQNAADDHRAQRLFMRDWKSSLAPQGSGARAVGKPLGGMHDFWSKTRLPYDLSHYGEERRALDRLEKKVLGARRHGHRASGHSAPGGVLVIAEKLIQRADALSSGTGCVAEAVRGAVLAGEALDLLGGQTPTLSVEALRLKHQCEVLAECHFSGVEYHIAVRPRLVELRRDVERICYWFHPRRRRVAALNAEMHILTHLVKIFRDRGQYDEEQSCLNRMRHLHNTLWMRQVPVRYLLWPLIRYIEWLLSSFFCFCLTLLGLVLVFSGLYTWAGAHPQWIYGLEDALTSFFSVGGPIHHQGTLSQEKYPFAYVSVVCIAIVAGCVHLGVFISHLYSMMSRK